MSAIRLRFLPLVVAGTALTTRQVSAESATTMSRHEASARSALRVSFAARSTPIVAGNESIVEMHVRNNSAEDLLLIVPEDPIETFDFVVKNVKGSVESFRHTGTLKSALSHEETPEDRCVGSRDIFVLKPGKTFVRLVWISVPKEIVGKASFQAKVSFIRVPDTRECAHAKALEANVSAAFDVTKSPENSLRRIR